MCLPRGNRKARQVLFHLDGDDFTVTGQIAAQVSNAQDMKGTRT